MIVRCPECRYRFDDAERSTTCPHRTLPPAGPTISSAPPAAATAATEMRSRSEWHGADDVARAAAHYADPSAAVGEVSAASGRILLAMEPFAIATDNAELPSLSLATTRALLGELAARFTVGEYAHPTEAEKLRMCGQLVDIVRGNLPEHLLAYRTADD